MCSLGDLLSYGREMTPDYARALQCYRRADEEKNSPYAQCRLGSMYEHGQGVATNLVMCATYYRKAADQDYPTGVYNLGVCVENGVGVAQDDMKAVELYRRAIVLGHTTAKFNLAHMYRDGHGVPQDVAMSLHWYHRAADEGYAPANDMIRIIEKFFTDRNMPIPVLTNAPSVR
jgi:TPR repeat protein